MFRYLLFTIALIGCSPDGDPVHADAEQGRSLGLPDKTAPDHKLEVPHDAPSRSSGPVRRLGGQEGEPVWEDGLTGATDDADGGPAPPPAPSETDTGDTGLD
jgi:hypothetical protein